MEVHWGRIMDNMRMYRSRCAGETCSDGGRHRA
eukprot:SAG11_NODE_838_length_6918_cov_3.566945_1_plen_32_part_10